MKESTSTNRFTSGKHPERFQVEITKPELTLDLGPKAPEKLRVALLSDFHFDPRHESDFARHYISLTNAEKPDLVLLLGDFSSKNASRINELTQELATLQAPEGVYAILGNHDFWSDADHVEKCLTAVGIPVLRNRLIRLPIRERELVIVGLESVWSGKPNREILTNLEDGTRALLAFHEPDGIDELTAQQRKNVALQVSGHTHGGQICAPFDITLVRAKWGRKYVKGHYEFGDGSQLYVNRGIGTLAIHARLFCRPEITILNLRNATAA